MSRFFFFAAAIAFASTLPACATPDTDGEMNERDENAELQGDVLPGESDPVESTEQESTPPSESESLGGRTGLSPNCFWRDDTQMTLRLYGFQSLVVGGVLRPAHSLISGCGNVPEYLVRCALAQGETVETAAGDIYEGQFGLAPTWVSEKLSSEQQALVTACLVQHLADEKGVSMVLEGPALEEPYALVSPESIAGGNLFMGGTVPVGEAAFQAYVCADGGIEQACGGASEEALRQRMCGKSVKCGLTFVGACRDVCEFDDRGLLVGCSGDIGASPVRLRMDAEAASALHGDVCP